MPAARDVSARSGQRLRLVDDHWKRTAAAGRRGLVLRDLDLISYAYRAIEVHDLPGLRRYYAQYA